MMNKPFTITSNKINHTVQYYQDGIDDYYKTDEAGLWYGQGAAALGLTGAVNEGKFKDMLLGQITANDHISRVTSTNEAGTSGYDFTFSPPKSVTIQALVGKDGNIVDVHDMAVKKSMDAIERHLIARKRENGITSYERTGNAVFATFRHETNRNTEPQLHTHAILINATQRSDGTWRAFDNNEIFKLRSEFSRIYDTELAKGLKDIGYDIRFERDSFELSHISRDQIEAFSGRTMEINQALVDRGLTRETASPEMKQVVTLETRAAKETVDRKELQIDWEGLATDLKIDFNSHDSLDRSMIVETKNIIHELEKKGSTNITKPDLVLELKKALPDIQPEQIEKTILRANEIGLIKEVSNNPLKKSGVFEIKDTSSKELEAEAALRFSISHLGERKAVMKHGAITDIALKHSFGNVGTQDLEKAINRLIATGELVKDMPTYIEAQKSGIPETQAQMIGRLVHNGYSETDAKDVITNAIKAGRLKKAEPTYTTKDAIIKERSILNFAAAGKGIMPALTSKEAIEQKITAVNPSMAVTQKDAAVKILTTTDRVIGIQGYAGTGKSYMLKTVIQEAKELGYTVRAIAPYTNQVKELKNLGVDGETLEGFIQRQETTIDDKTIVILDESGVASSRQMNELLKEVEKQGSRIVLLGDVAQTKAIEAGRPFQDLQASGVDFSIMDEIRRQKELVDREAVLSAAIGDIKGAIDKLRDIREVTNVDKRYQNIAEDYCSSLSAGKSTLVVTGTNASKDNINHEIRNKLGYTGENYSPERVQTLSREDTTRAQRKHAHYYSAGDVIQIEKTQKGLTSNDRYEVSLVNNSASQITLRPLIGNQNKEILVIDPKELVAVSVYKNKAIDLVTGEKVKITRNDAALDLANGDLATIKKINPTTLTLDLNGREVSLSRNDHLHLDYAYCTTAHSAQGMTVDKTIVNLETISKTTAKPTFYVAISRHKEDVTLYVDKRDKLLPAVSRDELKRSALDLVNKTVNPVEKKNKVATYSVMETGNQIDYKKNIVKAFCSLPAEKQKDTKILVFNGDNKNQYDHMIRAELKLEGSGQKFAVKKEIPLTVANAKDISTYNINDVVSFARGFPKVNLLKDTEYKITKINPEKNIVHLEAADGYKTVFNPLFVREVKKLLTIDMEISPKEQLRATKDMPELSVKKGDELKIKTVTSKALAVITPKGEHVFNPIKTPLYAEYAYSTDLTTVTGGKKIAHDVIIDMSAKDNLNFNKAVLLANKEVNVCVPKLTDLPETFANNYKKVDQFDIQTKTKGIEAEIKKQDFSLQ